MLFLLLLLSHRCRNGFDFHDEHLIGFYCGFQTKSYSTRRFLLSLCVCSTQSEQNSVLKMVRGIFGPMILLLSLSFTNRNRFILHFYDRNSFHFLYSRKKGNEWQNGTRFGIKLHREFEYLSLWREHSLFRRVFTFCFHRLALFCLDGITCKSQFEMVDDDFRLLRARQPIPWEIGVYEILQGTTPSDWELPLPIRAK